MKPLPTRHKILMLITNLGKGGAQRVFYDHAQAFNHQFEVIEAVFDKNEDSRIYDSKLPLFSLDVQQGKTPVQKITNFQKRAKQLKQLVNREKVQLTISHMDGANWVNVLSGTKEKKILVVHGSILHDYTISSWVRILRKKLIIPLLYNKATLTVAVSEGIKYELQHNCKVKNVTAIPNFFDVADIQQKSALPISEEWEAVFSSGEVLITSGRLHDQKKQRYLLPLLKRLVQQRKGLKLIILGDGGLRENLLKEAAQLELRTYTGWNKSQSLTTDYDLYFPGYISNPFQFLKRGTLFVFPSGWEGFPLALCEAMISGVPVLSADCPTGPREILSPGTFDPGYTLCTAEKTSYGYLLPMVDKPVFNQVWEETILQMLQDAPARESMRIAAQQRMKDFDKATVLNQWIKVIGEVLEK